MKIGILEIMPVGHFTLVESLLRIFTSVEENNIFLCVRENGEKNLLPLSNLFNNQITIIRWDSSSPLKLLFKSLNEYYLDRLYIVTLEKYYKDFFSFTFNCQIDLFIHNIDEWFDNRFSYVLYHLFHEATNLNSLIYSFKKNTYHNYYKKKIVRKILKKNGKFVVLNSTLKNELKTFIPENKIEVIPFSVYNSSLKCELQNQNIVRICIPGMISELRRDYYLVSKILFNNLEKFKGKIEIVLLGFISNKEFGYRIIEEFKRLNDNGMKVTYFTQDYIPLDIFDQELANSDIVLGNIKLNIDKYSQYGKTKETGIPFTMIRAAKPGVLPQNYPSLKELESSTIRFSDSDSLTEILTDLISENGIILKLKSEALKNSLKFHPAKLYQDLISK